jgi:hypothetical protein
MRGIAKRVKEAAAVSNPLATIRAAWGDQESADAIPVKPQVDEGDRAVSVCGSPTTPPGLHPGQEPAVGTFHTSDAAAGVIVASRILAVDLPRV